MGEIFLWNSNIIVMKKRKWENTITSSRLGMEVVTDSKDRQSGWKRTNRDCAGESGTENWATPRGRTGSPMELGLDFGNQEGCMFSSRCWDGHRAYNQGKARVRHFRRVTGWGRDRVWWAGGLLSSCGYRHRDPQKATMHRICGFYLLIHMLWIQTFT